jgi:hypothetical protein
MGTTILAWLIAILGLLMIAGGVWDVVDLWNQRRQTIIPLRNWSVAIGMICGSRYCAGLALIAHASRSGLGGALAIWNERRGEVLARCGQDRLAVELLQLRCVSHFDQNRRRPFHQPG